MSDYIIQRSLGVKIFGEEQFDYTVGGVEGQGYDMAVSQAALRRALSIEEAMKAYMKVTEVENTKLEELSEALAIISKAAAKFKKDDKTSATVYDGDLWRARYIMSKYGINTSYLGDGELKKENADMNKTLVQNAIDMENTSLQQNIVMLQTLNDDRDSAFKLASTLQQKASDTLSSGISNIR